MAPRVIVVMGVSGSGKTTVGALLAGKLGWPYAEADEFHPPANVAKMAAGHPLTDEDRWPWLQAIRAWIGAQLARGPWAWPSPATEGPSRPGAPPCAGRPGRRA